ncbi:MAG: hypothetical protein IH899_21570 [Planctomycetes bacterium]|nr:hypothetical protein [Planctomycetota bacterium]
MDASSEVNRCKKLLDELKLAVKACEDRMSANAEASKDAEADASELVAASTS